MPQFTKLEPTEVAIGRGRAAALAVAAYIEAIAGAQAGQIDLDEGESAPAARRYLARAAGSLGFKVRCSYDAEARAIIWKAVGA